VLIGPAFRLTPNDFNRQIVCECAPGQGAIPPALDEQVRRNAQAELHQGL
jgi:hypothetical protein